MTFILVQVAIFLLLYLVCRSIANRRGHGPQPESDPVKRNDQRDFEMAYRRVEANRQRETARAFRRQ